MSGSYCLWVYLAFVTASGERLNFAREGVQLVFSLFLTPHASCGSIAVLCPRFACFAFVHPNPLCPSVLRHSFSNGGITVMVGLGKSCDLW